MVRALRAIDANNTFYWTVEDDSIMHDSNDELEPGSDDGIEPDSGDEDDDDTQSNSDRRLSTIAEDLSESAEP